MFNTDVIKPVTLLVLCSNSQGEGNNTTASMYFLIYDGSDLKATFINGSTGCIDAETDLWSFSLISQNISIIGPYGPCRYGFITNIEEVEFDLHKRSHQV